MATIKKEKPSAPIMALTHSTKSEYFFEMLQNRLLCKRECNVFKEELVYLFYGRPSYKPYRECESTTLGAFRPISIIFDPNFEFPIKRIYPFDTGAFKEGLYREYIPSFAELSHFEIEPTIDHAAKSVSYFFNSNLNYYHGKASHDLEFAPTNLTISSLQGLFQTKGLSKVDDRKSAIEIQCSDSIELSRDSVMAICMPGDYCEDSKLYNLITKDWSADIIEYDIYHDSPNHDMREVLVRVKKYLTDKGLL